jgi:hypothetical protein
MQSSTFAVQSCAFAAFAVRLVGAAAVRGIRCCVTTEERREIIQISAILRDVQLHFVMSSVFDLLTFTCRFCGCCRKICGFLKKNKNRDMECWFARQTRR